MTNYVKCEGTDCKRKESCERWTSTPLVRYQAYLCMPVSIKVVSECKWFVDSEGNK